MRSLNPCFNGRYSQRQELQRLESISTLVLILVLMEDTLRATVNFESIAVALS